MFSTPLPPHADAAGALDGRAIVIVGGTSGIGRSAAHAIRANGARVVVLGTPETVDEARDLLPADVVVLAGDARTRSAAEEAIEVAVRTFGRLDGLYHVAGGSGRRFGDGPLHTITDEGWRDTLDLNLTSVFLSNRAATQRFLAQGSGGAIVNVTSVLAFAPSARHFATHAYAAAKAGIIGLTKASAARYAADRIRFNAIAPGLIDTPMSARAVSDPDIRAAVAARQPIDGGRLGQPGDLDGAAVFLLSDASRFVTGQVLAVDGGWSVTS